MIKGLKLGCCCCVSVGIVNWLFVFFKILILMYDEENGCSSTVQMLKAFGIGYSSPTMASVMSDLLPAFTFVLAVICRCNS